jgi:hypothetical protein
MAKLSAKMFRGRSNILSNIDKVLTNKYVLYFVFFLSICDLYFLTVQGKLGVVSIFILVGFLTSFFSKNMVVILVVALVIANLFALKSFNMEGFEDGADAGADAGTKAKADTKADAGADSGADAGTKADTKVKAGTGTDVGADAGADAGASTSTDASTTNASTDKSTKALTDLIAAMNKQNGENAPETNQPKINPKEVVESYKNLLSLQGEIQAAMTDINTPLSKAEGIVKNLKKQLGLEMVQG